MKVVSKKIGNEWYDVVIQKVSPKIFMQVNNIREENGFKEVPLNDYAMRDGAPLPYSIKINKYIDNAIEAGAELLLFKIR